MKRTPRQAAFVAMLPIVALSLGMYALVWRRDIWSLERDVWLCRLSGWIAAAFLLAALAATPLARAALLFGRPLPGAWVSAVRRALGVGSALLGLAHGLLVMSGYLGWNWDALLHRPYLRAGGVAWLVLAAMAITSFSAVVRVLRIGVWKELHRMGYAAFALVFLHVLLGPFAPKLWVLWIFGVALALAFLRVIEPAPERAAKAASDSPREPADG